MAKNEIKDNIIPVDVRKQYMSDMARYSLYALFERYIPEIEDGLKKVQRRAIYCMWHDIKAISKSSKRKSANTVGQCIAMYHAHGDCLRGNTLVYLLDGTIHNIEDLYNNGIFTFESLGVNELTLQVEPIIVHDIRIGQYTNKVYHITLSNGSEIQCTANHPFMLANGTYIKAEDMFNGALLYSETFKMPMQGSTNDGRPLIGKELIQDVVWNFYNGLMQPGYVKHHINHNKMDNRLCNLQLMTRGEHALLHGDYNTGLAAGRASMATEGSAIHAKNKLKNSKLMSIYMRDQNFRRFKDIINEFKASGTPVTIENYEALRPTVYNLPKISTLIKRGYGNSFEDLINAEIESVGEIYAREKAEKQQLYHLINNDKEVYYESLMLYNLFNHFKDMIVAGIEINYYNFISMNPKWMNKFTEVEFNCYLSKFYNTVPIVTNIYIEETNNEPMYDFTVDTTHNMLFPAIGPMNNMSEFPMVCLHNSSVYDAMKVLTNWFEIKEPLIVYDSNSGSLQGGPQAAMRYTESYVSQFCQDVVIGELMETDMVVDWLKTFDNHTMEPKYFPVKIPLLLVNGTFSICIGRRVEVPKHSLNDVIDATIAVLKNPNAKVVLIPDPCQKCEIIDTDWKKIANMGFGYFTERGIIEIENNDKLGTFILHLKSMPDMIFADTVTEKINDLIKENKLVQITDIQDHSTEDQLDIWLILKKGSDPEYVKQVIYKNTPIQDTKRVNMEVIMDDEIKRVSYKAYIVSFIEFRRNVKFRLYNARLQKAETRLHTIEIYITILESGDVEKIIHAIRNQKPSEENELIEWLMKRLKITDVQAKFILNTEIKRLSKSSLSRYKEEQKALNLKCKEYIDMITKPELIDKEIEAELKDIKAKYGKPRQSILISEADASDIPKGTFKMVVYSSNYIKKIQPNDHIKNFKNDPVRSAIIGDNTKDLLLFDEMGKVFRLPIHKIAFSDKNSPGVDIRMIIKNLTSNIISVMYLPILEDLNNKTSKYFLVVITNQGIIKKMDLADIINTTPSGILYTKLNKGDFVKDIVIANHKSDVIVYTHSKAIRISIDSIPYLKRSAAGSISIRSTEPIDGISVVTSNTKDVIVVTAKGRFNRISQSALARSDRGKAGSKVIKLTKGDYITSIFTCNSNTTIRCIHNDDTFTDIQSDSIEMGSSVSAGVKLCREIVKAEHIMD